MAEISIFDYEPKPTRVSNRVKYIYPDRTKKFVIICFGKIISKHLDFYHAQTGVENHLKNDKINNAYEILSMNQLSCKHLKAYNGYCQDCIREIECHCENCEIKTHGVCESCKANKKLQIGV